MRRHGSILCMTVILFLTSAAYGAEKVIVIPKRAAEPEPAVVERVIKVEGSVERPRVIFILPRGRLWREDLSKRSFVNEMLEPVYPESAIEDIFSHRTVRR